MPRHYVTLTAVGLGSMWKFTLMKRYDKKIIISNINKGGW